MNDFDKLAHTSYSQLRNWKIRPETIVKLKSGLEKDPPFETAFDYFLHTEKFQQIKFNVESLDQLTDGGIDVGSITEIFGEAGSGKTQLAMQLALSCVLPMERGGLGGKAIFISTDKHVPTKRLAEMASYLEAKLGLDTKLLDRIFALEFYDWISLQPFVTEQLPRQLRKHPDIRLIVIDSVAGIFRQETDYIQRASNMRDFVQVLERLADIYNFAIITTNHVTATPQVDESTKTIASLGHVWDSLVVTRLKVEKTTEVLATKESVRTIRKLEIVYSPRLPCGSAKFIVDSPGIVGVD